MLYSICPECGYARRAEDEGPRDICPRCQLVFWKWEMLQRRPRAQRETLSFDRPSMAKHCQHWISSIKAGLTACPETDWFAWLGRCGMLLLLVAWSSYFFVLGPDDAELVGASFLHRVDLVFHEAGHVLFSPFGDFLHVLGGTLGQVLMPAVVALAFLLKNRDPFGAAVGLWWFAQNAMDVAIYVNDAQALALPLLGGGTGFDDPERHDWHYLLSVLGLLRQDRLLAAGIYAIGRMLMLAACLWGGLTLARQFTALKTERRTAGRS